MKFVEKDKVKGPWLDHNICSILQDSLWEEMNAVYAAQYVTLCVSNKTYLSLEKQTK